MERKKVLIIISSRDKSVITAGLLMALASKRQGLYEDIKVHFFGPSQRVAVEDEEVQQYIADLIKEGINPLACEAISRQFDLTVQLHDMGFDIVQIPVEISRLVNQGYVPMVF
ncbi:hypothetical protein HPY42_02085 [Coprothermobacteraceae bacterium]|nr:hypothetical protein [Coprothermobacteraceae bacterium]